MGRLILRGMGLAIGLALWPLALPVAVLVGLGLAVKAAADSGAAGGQTGCCGDVPPSPGYPLADEPVFTPQLEAERARAMAVVAEVNREHLERSLRAD